MQVIELIAHKLPADSTGRWAEGQRLRLPSELASMLGLPDQARGSPRDVATLPPVQREHAAALRLWRAYTTEKPTSSRLPVSYQAVPPLARKLLASAFGRWRRHSSEKWAAFPGWPIDLSVDLLLDLAGDTSPFAGVPTPVLLSHDIDSPEGLGNLVAMFLDIEERAGARSVNYIVPCAWPIDHGLLGEVRARGHEVGVHGYNHANRTPFAAAHERRRRLEAARGLIDRYSVRGYRAPSLLRTPELLADLAGLYAYDSSIPTSGGLFPVPNNGCASARPFRIGELIEIPVSLPRDGSLQFLGHSPSEILAIWTAASELIARSGGVIVLLTHCEPRFSGNLDMLALYRDFVGYLAADRRYRFSTTAEVLASHAAHDSNHRGTLERH